MLPYLLPLWSPCLLLLTALESTNSARLQYLQHLITVGAQSLEPLVGGSLCIWIVHWSKFTYERLSGFANQPTVSVRYHKRSHVIPTHGEFWCCKLLSHFLWSPPTTFMAITLLWRVSVLWSSNYWNCCSSVSILYIYKHILSLKVPSHHNVTYKRFILFWQDY
jgi:hypothetical protein